MFYLDKIKRNEIRNFQLFIFSLPSLKLFLLFLLICRYSSHLQPGLACFLVILRLIACTISCVGMNAGPWNKEQRINLIICFWKFKELVIYQVCRCRNLELTGRISTVIASSSTTFTTFALSTVFTCTTYL